MLLLPGPAFGQGGVPGVSGEIGVIARSVDGARESAKFEEYRDIPEGLAGDARLHYSTEGGYFLDLRADGIAQDDQFLGVQGGKYGKYKIELIYDKIPHRFVYDARTLYTGVGTGDLVISNAIKTNLQNSTSTTDVANRVRDFLTSASTVDLQLIRKTGKGNFELMAFDPFNFRLELSRENRTGTRPFSGTFGFGNSINLPEPIDYDTTQLRLIGEYARNPWYVNATYYLSVFENHIGTLRFDNPFRITDSTAANAYTLSFQGGPSKGLIDLYPNNTFHNVSLSAAYKALPLKSTISATASWGWMRQDDDLVPYTTNTAMSAGAVSGVPGVPVPFNAFDIGTLPARKFDGKVNTSLYHLLLTSRPLNFMNVKARYRYYSYENKSELISFPGHNRMDAVWEPEHENNIPTSYTKQTAAADLGFDIFKGTRFTLGYAYENTDRTNREGQKQDDNTIKGTLDTKPLAWLDLRASYEKSWRTVNYNFRIPFVATHLSAPEEAEEFIQAGTPVPQLPFLRKFDQTDRKRDRVQLLATVSPLDSLTLSGSFIYSKDDFNESPFGLRENDYYAYSLEADYALWQRVNLFALYSYEVYKSKGRARQWTPGAIGDPFGSEPGLSSNSNWDFEPQDRVHTLRGGFSVAVIPKKLDFKLVYTYVKADGKVSFSSPLGTTANDNNPFLPLNFDEVDNSILQNLEGAVRYNIYKGLSITLGYMWERLKVEDFNLRGFTHVPVTPAGVYQAALLMAPPASGYNVHVIYSRLAYSF